VFKSNFNRKKKSIYSYNKYSTKHYIQVLAALGDNICSLMALSLVSRYSTGSRRDEISFRIFKSNLVDKMACKTRCKLKTLSLIRGITEAKGTHLLRIKSNEPPTRAITTLTSEIPNNGVGCILVLARQSLAKNKEVGQNPYKRVNEHQG
jgi:hypothetical protein